jgi:HEAT repeat protein
VLATHAGDDAKRSFAQRESASEGLAQLAHGAALDDLMARACDPSADTSLHATGILRELGSRCAARVLDRLEVEMDSERRERLTGVMLAMGEEVAPALAEAIAAGSKRRQRLALRLAGETQNPRLVLNLREAMLDGHDEVAREAAHALLRIGDVSSLEALAEGLTSPRASVAGFAAYSLGASGRVLAVAPLADALKHALAANQLALAREFVRALGRLGRAEAARPVAAILAHGGFFQRRKLRDLKLAAITALSGLPGRDAADALARAARSSDAQLRQPAALAQKRRARGGKPG